MKNNIVTKSTFRSNPNHEPAGSSEGGQFAPGDGGGGGGGGSDGSNSSGGEILSHYVEAAHTYQSNPSESAARATMTKLSNLTIVGAEFSKLHAGSITVYRAGGVKKTGLSFSKSLAEARKQLFEGETKIVKLTLTKRDPALDMNKLVPDSRYSHEQEVFIDFRKIDKDRVKIAEKDLVMSVIHKTHASDTSGMDFILSDATPDRYGDVILADGWDLVNFRKNPIALFGHKSDFPIGRWENLRVKDGALIGHLKMAPLGTSERIDEIRKLIEAGILKAVSVGFRPLESKPISKSAPGEIYVKSELVETSVVSVPANPNALAVVKSLGISRETQEMIFAKHGTEVTITQRSGSNGKHAKSNFFGNRMKDMTPLAKRIEDVQTKVLGFRDQLEQHLQGIDDDAPDDAATAVTDTLTQQLEAQEKSLESLKRAEAQLAKAASSTSMTAVATGGGDQDRGSEQTMTIQRTRPFAQAASPKPKPSDYIFKAVAVDIKHFGEGRKRPILEVLKENYGEDEILRTVMSNMVTKAAAIPADTTTSGWASNLVQTVIGDFIASLLPLSVYPKLAAKGGSFTFGRNGVISLPARNTATTVAGAFVAQGAPIPVRQGAFTSISLTPKKMGVITTLTREITEHSIPAIEAIVRQAMLEDTAVAIDTVLLDANAATTTRPAGLKNGVSVSSVSGTASIVGFVADLKTLAASLISGTSGNLRAPVWIINPGDVLAAALLQTTVGETPFREELAGGTLLGYPIFTTTTGVADTMFLVDAADFVTATGDTPQFSVSDQAVLHMEDTTPLAIGTAGTPPTVAAPVRSLFQTDSMAIRMILDINWAMRRTGCVAWTTNMAWN